MASGDDMDSDLERLVLNGITPLDCPELGRGAYGRVYAWSTIAERCVPPKRSTPFWSKEDKYKCSSRL